MSKPYALRYLTAERIQQLITEHKANDGDMQLVKVADALNVTDRALRRKMRQLGFEYRCEWIFPAPEATRDR